VYWVFECNKRPSWKRTCEHITIWNSSGMILERGNQRTQRKTYPSTTLSTEVPYGLTQVQAQGSTVRRWHLTTSTMAQPPHRGGPGSHPGQSMWDLWWTKWHWDRSFSEFFSFPVNIISLWLHTHISSGDKQKAC
jgi:hypothetical protein